MNTGCNTRWIAIGVGAVAAVVVLGGLFIWLWNFVAEIDRQPPRGGLKVGMMHRKTVAMQDILDGLIRDDWARVGLAAERMETYGDTIQWYLSVPGYTANGESFREATSDLLRFVRVREAEPAKEAALRLERSCLECHLQRNQQKP